MGYLHGNCGGCHNPNGASGFTGLHMRHLMNSNSEPQERSFATAVNVHTSMFSIPNQAESFRVEGGNVDASAIHYRMSVRNTDQMPPVGTKLIADWVKELSKD